MNMHAARGAMKLLPDDPVGKRPVLNAEDELLAFALDDITRSVIEHTASDMGLGEDSVEAGGIAEAMNTLGVVPAPSLLIVDVSGTSEPEQDVDVLLSVVGRGTRVVVVGEQNDVGLYRRLVDAGVDDYLAKPLDRDGLKRAISRTQMPVPKVRQDHKAPLFIVVGLRGGVGASTVALNCAWLAANEGKKTTLVDLDLQFGTLALSLNVEPGQGLRDALETPDRIDEVFVDRAMTPEKNGLRLLGTEEPLDQVSVIQGDGVERLLGELRKSADVVAVDMPRMFALRHASVLAQATDILLVSDLSLAGLRDANRMRRRLKQVGGSARVSLVVNQVRASGGQLDLRDYKRGLQDGLDFVIPFDGRAVGRSCNEGVPLGQLGRRSKVVVAMRKIVARVGGETKPVRRSRMISFRNR